MSYEIIKIGGKMTGNAGYFLLKTCSDPCFSSSRGCGVTFPRLEMKKILSFVPIGIILLLTACDGVPDDYRLPPQEFTKVLELNGRESGTLFGRILFPSAYTQRSVRFTVGGRTFITQPDGRFLVESIPVGSHRLSILVKNYEPITQDILINGENAVQSGPWRLKMARGKVIGRLISENGKSTPGVDMRLLPLGEMAKTDADGIFQFLGVNSGSHVLRIMDSQFFTYNREFKMDKGEQRNLGNIKVFRKAGYNQARNVMLEKPDNALPAIKGDSN